jgi:hypothetical protein
MYGSFLVQNNCFFGFVFLRFKLHARSTIVFTNILLLLNKVASKSLTTLRFGPALQKERMQINVTNKSKLLFFQRKEDEEEKFLKVRSRQKNIERYRKAKKLQHQINASVCNAKLGM